MLLEPRAIGKDEQAFHLVMDLCTGGDLFTLVPAAAPCHCDP